MNEDYFGRPGPVGTVLYAIASSALRIAGSGASRVQPSADPSRRARGAARSGPGRSGSSCRSPSPRSAGSASIGLRRVSTGRPRPAEQRRDTRAPRPAGATPSASASAHSATRPSATASPWGMRVAGDLLQRVGHGVPRVQDRPAAASRARRAHHLGLDLDAPTDQPRERGLVPAEERLRSRAPSRRNSSASAMSPCLTASAMPPRIVPLGQRGQHARIRDHRHRRMEGADQVLALRACPRRSCRRPTRRASRAARSAPGGRAGRACRSRRRTRRGRPPLRRRAR